MSVVIVIRQMAVMHFIADDWLWLPLCHGNSSVEFDVRPMKLICIDRQFFLITSGSQIYHIIYIDHVI